ncbi:hypothetical protein L1049_003192 [Liquidambar formosana]|uniref:Protein TIFY n=1 Tax=Liquidambar formosana TaxID=63359 RepID=A0AAP0NLU8_LIQFO
MERDFLGLKWKDPRMLLKEKNKDRSKDSVIGVQWPFANMVNSLPPSMPLKPPQENKQRTIGYPSLTPSIFQPVLTGDAFNSNGKHPPSLAKKNYDAACKLPLSNRKNSNGKSNSIPLGEIWVVEQLSKSPSGVSENDFLSAGTIDLRRGDKLLGSPAQLTIFYADTVYVYDNISSDKAKAIVCFAGNGSSMSANTYPSSMPVVGDNHRNQAQPPQIVNSRQSQQPSTASSNTVPQARRASLARFLEKRKDRLTNAMPYSLVQKLLESTDPQVNKPQVKCSTFMQQGAVSVLGSNVGGNTQICTFLQQN